MWIARWPQVCAVVTPGCTSSAGTDCLRSYSCFAAVLLRGAAQSTVQGRWPKHDIGTRRRRHVGRAVVSARLRPVKTVRGGFLAHHQRRHSHAARDAFSSSTHQQPRGGHVWLHVVPFPLLGGLHQIRFRHVEASVSPRSCPAGWPSMPAASPTLGSPKPSPGRTRASAGPAVLRCGSWQCPRPQPARARAAAAGVSQCPPLGPPAGYHAVPCAPQAPPKAGPGISGRRLPGLKRPFNAKGRGRAGPSASSRLWRQGKLERGKDSPSRLRGKGPTELNMERIGAAQEPEDHRRLFPRWGR
jgi:hypothetical protein